MMNLLATLSTVVAMAVGGFFGHLFGGNSRVHPRLENAPTVSAVTTEKVASDPVPASTTLAKEMTTLEKSRQTASPLAIIPKGWATLSSELGFSINYPPKEMGAIYGYDESFQEIFFMPVSIISSDASSTENLSQDIQNLYLNDPLVITVIKVDSRPADVTSWAEAYLKKHTNDYGGRGTIISEIVTPITIAGVSGFQFDRSVEGEKPQESTHYERKEVFFYKGGLMYRIHSLAPSPDTAFLLSGLMGKKYLQRVDELVQQVLKTFIFDGSKVTKITVPKAQPPALTGEALARREKLLTALRSRPYYDVNTWYPAFSDPCEAATSTDPSTKNSISGHGLYVAADDQIADLHFYDGGGEHVGPFPAIPGYPFASPIEDRVSGVDSFGLGSAGYGLIFHSLMNGRIELVGKKVGSVYFDFRGDGNSCTIAEIPLLLMTPYSVATVPMTAAGDLGPISYDIDGDGVEDVEISLIHPLLPKKELQLEAVFTDMTGARIVH